MLASQYSGICISYVMIQKLLFFEMRYTMRVQQEIGTGIGLKFWKDLDELSMGNI